MAKSWPCWQFSQAFLGFFDGHVTGHLGKVRQALLAAYGEMATRDCPLLFGRKPISLVIWEFPSH